MNRHSSVKCRAGVTLIELLCVMLIIGFVAGVATLALRRFSQPDPADPYERISRARRAALESGVPTTIDVRFSGETRVVALNADGQVLADSVFHLDRFTGRRTDVAR